MRTSIPENQQKNALINSVAISVFFLVKDHPSLGSGAFADLAERSVSSWLWQGAVSLASVGDITYFDGLCRDNFLYVYSTKS